MPTLAKRQIFLLTMRRLMLKVKENIQLTVTKPCFKKSHQQTTQRGRISHLSAFQPFDI